MDKKSQEVSPTDKAAFLKRLIMRIYGRKHFFNHKCWPIGACISCGHRTGLDNWQLRDMPFDMAYCGPEAMGIDWMSGNELSQAIPPAYTHHLCKQLYASMR